MEISLTKASIQEDINYIRKITKTGKEMTNVLPSILVPNHLFAQNIHSKAHSTYNSYRASMATYSARHANDVKTCTSHQQMLPNYNV